MKRYIFAVTLLVCSSVLFAYCGSNATISSGYVPAFSGLSSTPANVSAFVWLQGKADWTTDGTASVAVGVCTAGGTTGGCDSNGITAMYDDTCTLDMTRILMNWGRFNNGDLWDCAGTNNSQYAVYTDWLSSGYDGCPTALASERVCILAYDTAGNYAVQSRSQGFDWVSWDSIGTTAAAPLSVATGTATYEDVTPYTADIAWGDLSGIAYGAFQAGDSPASPLITGFRTYFLDSAAAPASFATSAWTAGTLYAYGAANLDNFVYPTPANPATNSIFMSRSIIIDGIELPFVSTSYITLYAPSGAPAISGLSAVKSGLNTLVSWTSGDESQVTGYQVFWAPQGGQFSAVGSIVSPTGNNSDYTANVRIPATSSFNVKVGAHLTNGTVTYSATTSVKATNIIKDKTRVNVN